MLPKASVCFAVAGGVTLIILHFFWVLQNRRNNMRDIKHSFDYADEAHPLVSTNPVPAPPKEGHFLLDPIFLVPVGITVLLVFAILGWLFFPPPAGSG